MNRTYQITAAAVLAVVFVAIGRHQATTHERSAPGEVRVTQSISGGPSERQTADLSEKGLAAVHEAHLARMALNDGYIDNAKQRLEASRHLLDEVKKEDRPVTLTTEVDKGRRRIEHASKREVLDLIPIMTQIQIVEGLEPIQAQTTPSATPNAKSQPAPSVAEAAPQGETVAARAEADHGKVKAAIAQAKEHLSKGDAQAAAQALKVVDLALVARQVSMPMRETRAHIDRAITLVDDGKLHEANMELKKLQDGLVVSATVLGEPTQARAGTQSPSTSKAG